MTSYNKLSKKEEITAIITNFDKSKSKYYALAVLCGVLGSYLQYKLINKTGKTLSKNISKISDGLTEKLDKFNNFTQFFDVLKELKPNEFKEITDITATIMHNVAQNQGGLIGNVMNIMANSINLHHPAEKVIGDGEVIDQPLIETDFSYVEEQIDNLIDEKNDPHGFGSTVMGIVQPIFDIKSLDKEEITQAFFEVFVNSWNYLKSLCVGEFLLTVALGLEKHYKESVPFSECFYLPQSPELLGLVHITDNCTRVALIIGDAYAKKHNISLPKCNIKAMSPEFLHKFVPILPYIIPLAVMLIVHKLVLHFGLDREIKILEEMNEALAEYSKELQKLDLEQTEETVRIYREFSEKLFTFASEKELNDYLIDFMKENDIDFPYEGDFDEFMSNKVNAEGVMNILRFGF